MSHARKLLLHTISLRLHSAPFGGLEDLSRELRVSRRTIERTVIRDSGKTFRNLREEILVERVTAIFASHPAQLIKELSLDLGYNSPRSFARAVKRACGSSPPGTPFPRHPRPARFPQRITTSPSGASRHSLLVAFCPFLSESARLGRFCPFFPIGFSTSLFHIRPRSQALPPFLTCLLLLEVPDALHALRFYFSCACFPRIPFQGRSGPRRTAVFDTGAGTTHYCRYGQHEHSYFHSDQGESWSDPFPVLPGGEFRDKYGDGYHQ